MIRASCCSSSACRERLPAWIYWIAFHVSSHGVSYSLDFVDELVAVVSPIVGEMVLATRASWRYKLGMTLFNLTYPAFILVQWLSA